MLMSEKVLILCFRCLFLAKANLSTILSSRCSSLINITLVIMHTDMYGTWTIVLFYNSIPI